MTISFILATASLIGCGSDASTSSAREKNAKQEDKRDSSDRKSAKKDSEDEEFENPDVNSDAIDLAVMQFCDYLEEKYELESSDEALNMFKTGGYSLYLSVDSDVQEYLENKYADDDNHNCADER